MTSLYLVGAAAAVYAAMEGVEAIGLWLGRRWAAAAGAVQVHCFTTPTPGSGSHH